MSAPVRTVEDFVREKLAAELCCLPEQIAVDASMDSLPGLDSIKLMRVISEVERDYNVQLYDELLYELRTVADLANVVHAELGRRSGAGPADGHPRPGPLT
jgi:acyl carrier protein